MAVQQDSVVSYLQELGSLVAFEFVRGQLNGGETKTYDPCRCQAPSFKIRCEANLPFPEVELIRTVSRVRDGILKPTGNECFERRFQEELLEKRTMNLI